jgi:hypothetical protein
VIERMGFPVVRAGRLEEAEIVVQTNAASGCLVVDRGKKGIEGKTASLIEYMRKRGLAMPIVLLIRRMRFDDIPVEVPVSSTAMCFPPRRPGIRRKEPRLAAQAIRRDDQDPIFRSTGGLCIEGRPALDLARPQWGHLLSPQCCPDRCCAPMGQNPQQLKRSVGEDGVDRHARRCPHGVGA